VQPGSYRTAAIVLLTDGQTTAGPDTIEAARMAAERGVRIFTVGIGTTKGEVLGSEGWSMRVRLDEDALKSIAAITRGEYFQAGSAVELKKVYRTLNSRLVFEKKETEVTALFSAASAALMLAAAALSIFWFGRVL
jgi:Ca-activated chloride channel family protein